MIVKSAFALFAVFCFGMMAVFPASALFPSTNPNLAVRFVDPGLPADLIDPQHVVFDQYHNWNGTNFTTDVYLENLDIGWALTNANFTLSYNGNGVEITKIVSTTLDSAWTGTIDTTTPDTINVNASTSASLSGDVLVLEITFNIQGQGTTPVPLPYGYKDFSDMIFSNVSLSGDLGSIPVNMLKNGVVTVYAEIVSPEYMLEITAITLDTSKTVIGQGFGVTVNVTAKNMGALESKNYTFLITVYANTTPVGSRNITTHEWQANSTTITWNTTGFKGNYRISAYPSLPEGAFGMTMGLTDGWMTVSIVGDISGPTPSVPDGKVDIRDIAAIGKCYGTYYWDPGYNINYDLTGFQYGVPDRKIDIKDLALVAKNYGQTDP